MAWALAVAGLVASAGLVQAQTAAPSAGSAEALATFDAAWERIRESHYDPEMGGVDWNAVRDELRPRAAAAGDVAELRAVIREMLSRLGESHYALIPGDVSEVLAGDDGAGGDADPGLEVRVRDDVIVVNRVDSDGPADRAGVRPGWGVEQVGDLKVKNLLRSVDRLELADDRDRALHAWSAVSVRLRGRDGSTVPVRFEVGGGRTRELNLPRRKSADEPVSLGNFPPMSGRVESGERDGASGGTVGVIRMTLWLPHLVADFDAAVGRFRRADGIVIDLRGNPGGVAGTVMGTAGHFFETREPLGTMRNRGGELNFIANPRRVDGEGRRVAPFAGPVAILVDELSASTSEIFAAGLQATGRARVFGTRSAGQALPSLAARLPNGDVLQHAVADFRTPNGARLEGVGVVPDEPVPLRRKDLLDGRDAALDAAVRWILSGGKR